MTPLSLRARLTIWYTCALVVVLAAGAADVLWVLARFGTARVDRELAAETATLANAVGAELAEMDSRQLAAQEACRTVAGPGRAVAILDEHGAPLDARWDSLDPARALAASASATSAVTVETPSGAWRVHAERQTFAGGPMTILVATPLADVLREQRQVREAMLYGFPFVLIVAAAGGLWLAAIGLRPLTGMAAQAARIPVTGTEELGDPSRTDEIGQLAFAFNGLLRRLRTALQTQRQFMADASHELRTPVSVIRTAADVSLSRPSRPESHYRDTLAVVAREARRLGRLVGDMLTLARADAGGYPLRPVDLYLDELIAESARGVSMLAAERGVSIDLPPMPELPFRGDEDLLHELLRNVLQNAVQHSPAGGTVRVAVERDRGGVRIAVTDAGPGIAPPDRARIFDRFVQIDPARRGEGAGLGLPIARWIAEAHDGSLELSDSGPTGATFTIWLPLDPGREGREGQRWRRPFRPAGASPSLAPRRTRSTTPTGN